MEKSKYWDYDDETKTLLIMSSCSGIIKNIPETCENILPNAIYVHKLRFEKYPKNLKCIFFDAEIKEIDYETLPKSLKIIGIYQHTKIYNIDDENFKKIYYLVNYVFPQPIKEGIEKIILIYFPFLNDEIYNIELPISVKKIYLHKYNKKKVDFIIPFGCELHYFDSIIFTEKGEDGRNRANLYGTLIRDLVNMEL